MSANILATLVPVKHAIARQLSHADAAVRQQRCHAVKLLHSKQMWAVMRTTAVKEDVTRRCHVVGTNVASCAASTQIISVV
jgi:hypothetical protein